MIIIVPISFFKELKKNLLFLKISFRQNLYFSYLNLIRLVRNKKIRNHPKYIKNILHFSTSNTEYRSWHSYSNLESNLTRNVKQKFNIKAKKIKYLRIIFPRGLRSLKFLKIDLKEINKTNKKPKVISRNIFLNRQQISYFRNLNKLDIKLDSNIKDLSIQSSGAKMSFQIYKSLQNQNLNLPSTLYIVLDAISFDSFRKSKVYNHFFSKSEHILLNTFSPSSLTGSALPSLFTLKPVLCHLLGDYDKWFFSPSLECLSPDISTIAEVLNQKIEDSVAFTSFSKTMPFYGYHRGFNYYYNRCSGNNCSPSALDLFYSDLCFKM